MNRFRSVLMVAAILWIAIAGFSASGAADVPLPYQMSAEGMPVPGGDDYEPPPGKKGTWHSYEDRYAIIVMGGDESGQKYRWYWGDTAGMCWELIERGFTNGNIFFLSYGDSADAHPEIVDGTSNVANIEAAYAWAATVCDAEDLLYIYWVDHGDTTMQVDGQTVRVCNLVAHDGRITDSEYGALMAPITAKQIIGAYNPCFSGMVIDNVSRMGVISITSQDSTHVNSWGWAGQWRKALRNDPADNVDTNGDGHVSMAEAFNWIGPLSRAAGEHSMYDDNGDGIGYEQHMPGFDNQDPTKDGYIGNFYSLNGWKDGRVWTVGPSASNFTSIQAAMNAAGERDTVRVEAGLYYENVLMTPWVTLEGAGAGSSIIDGGGVGQYVVSMAYGTTIEGFTIRNSAPYQPGIWVPDVTCIIRDNVITDNGGDGITSLNSPMGYPQIERNLIKNCGGNCSGIYLGNSSPTIHNNTIIENDHGVGFFNGSEIRLQDNIIYFNHMVGVHCNLSTRIYWGYNDIEASHGSYVQHQGCSFKGVADSDIAMDPLFMNRVSGDYRLHAGSPCRNAGSDPGLDMGAYEFVPSATVGTPTGFLATSSGVNGSLNLSWNAASGAQAYYLYYGTVSGDYTGTGANGGASPILLSNVTSHTLSGLSSLTTYYLAVAARGAPGAEGNLSNESSAIPLDVIPPGNPTSLLATTVSSGISLTWVNPGDSDWTGTIIRAKSSGGYPVDENDGRIVYSGNGSSCTDTDVVNATQYAYGAFARDINGNSSAAHPAAQDTATAWDLIPPRPASDFTAHPYDGAIDLTWNKPSDPDFNHLRIRRSTFGYPTGPNDGSQVCNCTGTTIWDGGLVNGTEYFYSGFSYDAAGNYSDPVYTSGIPTDTTPPQWITSTGVQAAGPDVSEVALFWYHATDQDNPPVRYNVYYNTQLPATDGTKLADVYPQNGAPNYDNKFTVTGLQNGRTYYFMIRAEDSASPPNEDTNTITVSAMPEYKTRGTGVSWDLDNLVDQSDGGIEDGSGPGKYVMNGSVTIVAPDQITIAAGEELASSDVTGTRELIVEGTLVANGIPGNPVVFTSLGQSPGDWGGIRLSGPGAGTTLNECEVEYAATGIDWDGSDPTVTDCSVHDCSGVGIRLQSHPAETLTATGNDCRDNGGHGISVTIADSVVADISLNVVRDNYGFGISIAGFRGSQSTVNDNETVGNGGGIYCAFISGWAGEFMDIFQNEIHNNVGNGISISNSPQTLDVHDNQISGNLNGVAFVGEGFINARPMIRDNNITGNHADGIDVRQQAMPYILSNVISSNAVAGIHSFNWANVLVEDNTITLNSYGVFNDSLGCVCLGDTVFWEGMNNRLYSNSQYDVYNGTNSTVKAHRNWWGNAGTAEMDASPYPANISTIWDQMDNPSVGFVNYASWLHSGSGGPTITVDTPMFPDSTHLSFDIEWTDDDPDDDAVVSLYYVDENYADFMAEKVSIEGASNISEDDPTNAYEWDAFHVPVGRYYVGGVIDDGTTMAWGLSPEVLEIIHPDIEVGDSLVVITVSAGSTEDAEIQIMNSGSYDLTMSAEVRDSLGDAWSCVTLTSADTVLAPGSDFMMNVAFEADSLALGLYNGSIVIACDDPDEEEVVVALEIHITSPDIAVAETGHSYGTCACGDSREWSFYVHNEGTGSLWVEDAWCDDGNFHVDPEVREVSVAAGDSLEVRVVFHPYIAGPCSCVLHIESNDPDEPVVLLDLDGIGEDLLICDTGLDFGTVHICRTYQDGVVIYNNDTLPFSVTGASVGGVFFGLETTGYPHVVNPGEALGITVSFAPAYEDVFNGTLTVYTDHVFEPEIFVWLQGTGVRPAIDLSETDHDYGAVAVGSSLDWELVIRSAGTCDLTVSGITGLAVPFQVVSPGFPQVIVGGDSVAVTIRYSPTEQAGSVDTLHIESDDPLQAVVSARVVGQILLVPEISLSPAAWDEIVFPAGVQESYLHVINTGQASLIFNVSAFEAKGMEDRSSEERERSLLLAKFGGALGLLPAGDADGIPTKESSVPWLTIDPELGAVPPGDTVVVTLTVDAGSTAPGWYSATVRVESNDTDEPVLDQPFDIGVTQFRYANHDAGNVTFTVTDGGCYGYWDKLLGDIFGDGFQYPSSDPANYLTFGSFWAGTAPDRVMDGSCDYDWQTVSGGELIIDEGTPETGTARFDDSGAPSPLGLLVSQESVARADAPDDDYVIMSFSIENTGVADIDSLYLGLYMDWDVGNPALDTGGYAGDLSLGYQYDAEGLDSAYVGIALLSPDVPGSFRFVHNPTYVWPTMGAIEDSSKWAFMASGIIDTSPGPPDDWSMVMTVGPVSVEAGNSVGVSYAVVAGMGLMDLRSNTEAARAAHLTAVAVAEETILTQSVLRQNHPNPFNPRTTVAFSLRGPGHVSLCIYDVNGRLVRTLVVGNRGMGEHAVVWEGRDDSGCVVASGIYYCRLVTSGFVETKKMVLLK
ncbi:MAG: choice-of-anchor D domain-containing protein [Candidatus Eisenbacteria sp.]|nr:choice-of-anchor D domain-containing protein [Candidatus Eisenbacteria bacterium]